MFKFEAARFAAFRKQKMTEALAKQLTGARQVAHVDPKTGEVVARDARGYSRRIGVDENGFLHSLVSCLGRRWTWTNAADGKLLRLASPSGFTLGIDYTQKGLPAKVWQDDQLRLQLEYDAQGNISRLVHSDQTTTAFSWAKQGQPLLVTDRLRNSTRFEYDPVAGLEAFVDARGQRTSFEYDGVGRPAEIHYPDGTRDRFTYPGGGNTQQLLSGNELFAEIERDAKRRPIRIQYSDGDTLSFQYDSAGRILSASNREGEVKFEYNEHGLPTLEQWGEQQLRYEYDAGGLVAAMVLPTGERVEYGHDADMRPCSVRDWNGGVYSIEHAAADRGFHLRAPNGLTTHVRKSREGQVQALQVGNSYSANSVFHRSYLHDAEGRVVRIDESKRAMSYRYDAEGQLIAVASTEPAFCESFAYDPVGNRTGINGQHAEFGAANQLLRQGDVPLEYDARGNLVSMRDAQGMWHLEYNGRNLLTRVVGPAGTEVTFGYDALGRRLWKRSGAREVRYLWAGEHLVREERHEGNRCSVRDYIYQVGTFTPLAMRVDGRTYTFHTDHLGTPLLVTDCMGRKVWSAVYSAFGRARVEGALEQPLRFPGQYQDEETGLLYNRYRYYSPELGRYLSRDPLSFHAGLNLYLYAHNDPINGMDPLGLWSWKGALSVVAGVAAAAVVVVLAPVAAPLLAVAAAAVAIGAAVGFGLNRALEGGAFCLQCFLKGALEGLLYAAGAIVLIAGVAYFSAAAAAILGASLMIAGTVGLVSLAANWSDMSDEEKDHALGGLFLGAALGFRGVRGAGRSSSTPPNNNAVLGRGGSSGGGRSYNTPSNSSDPPPNTSSIIEPTNGRRRDSNGRLRDSKGRYTRDPETPSTLHNRKSEYPEVRQSVRDEVIRRNTRADGQIVDSRGRVIPRDQLTIEHKRPVVDHWNKEGYNQTRAQRAEWTNDIDNLTVMSRSENSSLGAKTGQTYRQDTGANYSPD